METPVETRIRIARDYGIKIEDVPLPRVIKPDVSGARNAKRMRMRRLREREGQSLGDHPGSAPFQPEEGT
jgi:hypothetical protein